MNSTDRPVRPLLAPFAFLAVATAAVLLLRPMVQPKHGTGVTTTPAPTHTKQVAQAPKTYTVHAGDTLEDIAAKTGVSTVTLQKLNPGLSPTSLFLGQKVRLR